MSKRPRRFFALGTTASRLREEAAASGHALTLNRGLYRASLAARRRRARRFAFRLVPRDFEPVLCLSLLTSFGIMMWFSVMFQHHGWRQEISQHRAGSRRKSEPLKMEKNGSQYPKVGNKLQTITSEVKHKQHNKLFEIFAPISRGKVKLWSAQLAGH